MCYTCGSEDYDLPGDIPEMIKKGRWGAAAKINELTPEQQIVRFKSEILLVRERSIHYWFDNPETRGEVRKDALMRPREANAEDLAGKDQRILFGLSVELDSRLLAWQHHFLTIGGYTSATLETAIGKENYDFVRYGHPGRKGESLVEELKMFAPRLLTDAEKAKPDVLTDIFKRLDAIMQFEDTASPPERPSQDAKASAHPCKAA